MYEARARTAAAAPEELLRERVEALIIRVFGRFEERLFESGLIDSLRAIELGAMLEAEFGVPISELSVHDLASVTTIVAKLSDALRHK
jgi:acyl carrier protein